MLKRSLCSYKRVFSKLVSDHRNPQRKQKGIALLMVIVTITILGVLAADFAYRAQVELDTASNARDKLKAEYLAHSSIEIGKLLISAQDQFSQQTKGLPKIPGFSLESIVLTDYAGLITNLLLGQEGAILANNESLTLDITYEDGKYPIHCSGGLAPNKDQQRNFYFLVNNMFRAPRYNAFFDKTGRDGIQISRENLPRWIIDWIDVDEQTFDPDQAGSSPEEKYSQGRESYEAHNLYMDTMEEFHLIRGIEEEEVFQTFANYFTIYHNKDCKVSLSGLGPQSYPLLTAILAASSSDKTTVFDPNTENVAKQLAPLIKTIWPLLRDEPLSKTLSMLNPGASENALKPPEGKSSFCVPPTPSDCPMLPKSQADSGTSTKKPANSSDQAVKNLSELICSPFLSYIAQSNLQMNPLMIDDGKEKPSTSTAPLRPIPLCDGALAQFLKTPDSGTPRRYYRIVSVGQVQRKKNTASVKIQAIWDAANIVSNPICNFPKCNRGTWLYYKVN